jgi:hypothetical protein
MSKFLLFSLFIIHFTLTYAQTFKTTEWINLTTSGRLPVECKLRNSNNNLDLVSYKSRYYLAFRTAPTHFASGFTRIYIVSSADLAHWTYEDEVFMERDLREPRFFVYKDTLNFYFFSASNNIFKFDPKHVYLKQTLGDGFWNKPKDLNLDGYVPWRIRERGDTMFLSAYYGKNIYRKNHKADLRLFYSMDALHWKPLSKEPQIKLQDAEEGEFLFDNKGELYALIRLEGRGAAVVRASSGNIADWSAIRTTPYKYDSSIMFSDGSDLYVIARKNNDGAMDKLSKRSNESKGKIRNLIRYWYTTKTTALYKLHKDSLTIHEIMEFPSTGDCAFPALTQMNDSSWVLMNYSSNIQGRKKSWFAGQLGKTYLYQTILTKTRK